MPPVHTIGHSTRTIEAFVALLRAGAVDTVVDIRTIPRSRTNPQFNPDALAAALAGYQIAHARIAALGALRKATAAVPPEVNGSWTNRSFHNYADYALTRDFRSGLADLEGLAGERRVAIMCAEAVWWHCHRRIVAEYLLASGREVPPDGGGTGRAGEADAGRGQGGRGAALPAGASGPLTAGSRLSPSRSPASSSPTPRRRISSQPP
jgi:hypothetical protein